MADTIRLYSKSVLTTRDSSDRHLMAIHLPSVGNFIMHDCVNEPMTVLFLGLNGDCDGWEKLGYVDDGKIREDPMGELEQTVGELPYLDDEERLTRQFNNHYINAVIVEKDFDETPSTDQ